ncbi:MAG: transcriptional regulator [Bacillota bacterium]
MDVIRVGDKVLSKRKIYALIDKALEMRASGLSQQEVACAMGLDRPFISRLEKLGEIRKGRKIGVVGFPVANKDQLEAFLIEAGADYVLLMSDEERWRFVKEKQGLELFNEVMEIISRLRMCDIVVFIGSNYRIKLCAALLDKEVVGIELGKSPIEGDKLVDLERIKQLFATFEAEEDKK